MPVELKVGDPAPEFRAQAVGGKYGAGQEVSLADFRGSAVVLYFYPKDDTPGCTAQACGLRDAWADLGGSREHLRRQRRFARQPREIHQEISTALSAPLRCRQKNRRSLRRLGGKKHVRQEIHGRGAEHVRHRRRGPDLRHFPQGEAGRTRRSPAAGACEIAARNERRELQITPIRCLHCAPQNAEFRSNLYGITEETPEGENLQAQAPQAHEGESPQEAFALQVVTAPRVFAESLRPLTASPAVRSWFARRLRRRYTREMNFREELAQRICPACSPLRGCFPLARSALARAAPSRIAAPSSRRPKRSSGETSSGRRTIRSRLYPAQGSCARASRRTQSRCAGRFCRRRASGRKRRRWRPRWRHTRRFSTSIPAKSSSPRASLRLLTRQEDFPRAIDILKDAIKANPKETAPYLQLAFIYAKYLQKTGPGPEVSRIRPSRSIPKISMPISGSMKSN